MLHNIIYCIYHTATSSVFLARIILYLAVLNKSNFIYAATTNIMACKNIVNGSFALLYSRLDELQSISLSHPHITRCKIVSGVRGTCSGSVTGRSDFFRDFFSIHNSLDRGQEGQHFSEIAKSLLGDVHIKNSLQMLSSRRK